MHDGDTYFSTASSLGEYIFSMNRLRGNSRESREEREAWENIEGIPAGQRLVCFYVKLAALLGSAAEETLRRKYESY